MPGSLLTIIRSSPQLCSRPSPSLRSSPPRTRTPPCARTRLASFCPASRAGSATAASSLSSRSATLTAYHAWGAEGVCSTLRADARCPAIVSQDVRGRVQPRRAVHRVSRVPYGRLYLPAHPALRRLAASAVLAADLNPALAGLVLDTINGHDSVWPYELPITHARPLSPRIEFDPRPTLGRTPEGPALTAVTAPAVARHAAPACANCVQVHIRAQRRAGHRNVLGLAKPRSPSSHHIPCRSLSVLFMLKTWLPPSPSLLSILVTALPLCSRGLAPRPVNPTQQSRHFILWTVARPPPLRHSLMSIVPASFCIVSPFSSVLPCPYSFGAVPCCCGAVRLLFGFWSPLASPASIRYHVYANTHH
jgi:hypothetical protein